MFDDLISKTEKIIKRGWVKSLYNGTGGIGITLEKLLNITTNTFEIPDYEQIEIKTKLNNNKGYISLFNATPDSYLFEIKRILKTYGYPDSKNQQYKVFNLSFYSNKKIYIGNNLYGTLKIDRKEKKIILLIIDSSYQLVDSDCSWSFELLKEKINRKLQYLFLVYADKTVINNEIYYKYLKYSCYLFKSFEKFLENFENGNLRITFKIGVIKNGPKKGQIKNHGTSFDINQSKLEGVFKQTTGF